MNDLQETATSTKFQRCIMERKMSAMTCTIFNELRLEGKLCDVVIKVNGIEFNAHKNILCGCSSYFRALFTSGWNNIEKRVYSIPGVNPDMMRLIIEYAYTRSVPVTAENVEPLLAAADQFCILGIVRACCDYLEAHLCLQNCIGICKFADFYSCPDLRRRAYLFILHHFEMVRFSEEFMELSLAQLCDIIKKDDLNVKQEDVVFEAVLRWINHSPQDRKAHVSVLLPKVRMALMTADYFMNNVKNNTLVKDNDDCKPIIISALKAMYDLNINGPSNTDFRNPLTRPRLPYAILLAIGGWSGGSPTNGIEAYDARADRWVNVTREEESPRAYHGAAYLNGFVYCVGGFDSVDYFNSVRKFNPVTRTWHQVAPMHSRRCYVSVAVLDGCIYAMGGFDGYVRLNTAESYEPETNQWTLIAPMHEQRSDASATTLHGKAYNPLTNTWRTVPTMFNPRSNFGIEVVDDLLFVVGGFNGFTTTFNVECYDEKTEEWYDAHNMGIFRSALSCCVVHGLPNVAQYAAPRDSLQSPREELKLSASNSILSV
uniref:Kelch like family member 10 n=1 Tax=Salmo trutta TaxID=8032 RepID=A0A674CLL1_SALTR